MRRSLPVLLAGLVAFSHACGLLASYGFGGGATGGRDGTLIHVTSLSGGLGTCPDSRDCTLRTAVATAGRRVVFDVSGAIIVSQPIAPAANVTIDGSSAPGSGVWNTNSYGSGQIVIGNSNVVLTHLRLRPAIQTTFDLIENSFRQGPVRSVATSEKLPIAADNGPSGVFHGPSNVRIYQADNAKDFRPETGTEQCSNFAVLRENQNECAGCAVAPCQWSDYSEATRQVTAHPLPRSLSAPEVEGLALAHAGARLPCVDVEDTRIVADAALDTGPSDWLSRANFAGPFPVLASGISAASSSLALAGVTTEFGIPNNVGAGKLRIDAEVLGYDNLTGGNTLTGLTRGLDATAPSAQAQGALVYGQPLHLLPNASSPVCAGG